MARFMRKGITKFFWVPTIADAGLTPTAAEVNAGDDITPDVRTVNGFNFSNQPIDTPDMEDTFTSQIPGEDDADDSNIELYEDNTDTTIHDALPKDDTGYMCIFYAGIAGATPAAADSCDVWPATVSANTRRYTVDNEAAMYQVDFAITATPAFEQALT